MSAPDDSELAAIQAALGRCQYCKGLGEVYAKSLLRKADELRAKLAEAQNGVYCPACGDAFLTAVGTEALTKLAEAERATGAYMRQFFAEQKRAEAAEARVRELEQAVRAVAAGQGVIR